LWNVHDCDGDSGHEVGEEICPVVVVVEPIGEGQILVQNLLPSPTLGSKFVLEIVESG
jgi:hypothetical protein